VQERSIPTSVLVQDALPAALDDGVLTLEFPPSASFLRRQAEEPGNVAILQEALYAVTGRRLGLTFAVGPERERPEDEHERPATEEEIVELMKSTFGAREVDGGAGTWGSARSRRGRCRRSWRGSRRRPRRSS